MKKFLIAVICMSFVLYAIDECTNSLTYASNASKNFYEVHFTKICKRCKCISHEFQMYAYNEWDDSWHKSFRSDKNRPDYCRECYFELQPQPKFLEKPINAYMIQETSEEKRIRLDNEKRKEDEKSNKTWVNSFYRRK